MCGTNCILLSEYWLQSGGSGGIAGCVIHESSGLAEVMGRMSYREVLYIGVALCEL